MNYTTFETSKRLKEAGYPQPDFETGQVWYNPNGTPVFIVLEDSTIITEKIFVVISLDTCEKAFAYRDSLAKNACCFAPDVTDLLKKLGDNYSMGFDTDANLYSVRFQGRTEIALSANPVEALSELWIESSPDATFSETIKWIK